MKKSFLKELLARRVPQILGSYFIGATTLIFFIDWLKNAAHEIDSLEVNFQTIINDKKWKTSSESWPHGEFRYYLRVLNVQDSIATAKITGSIYPFSKPKIGDKINIK